MILFDMNIFKTENATEANACFLLLRRRIGIL